MKANELRIGNCINYRGLFNILLGIQSPSPQNRPELSDKYLAEINPPDSFFVGLDELSPIPLSPEILEKCEFDRSKPILWIEKDYSINLDFYHENCQDTNGRDEVWVYYNNAKLCDVKYLHQLQNLYYALCGEELTFKP